MTEQSSTVSALGAEARTFTPEGLAEAARAIGARDLEDFAGRGLSNAEVRTIEARLETPVDPWTVHAILVLRGDEDTLAMQVAGLVNVLQIGDGMEAWEQLHESGKMSLGQQYEMTLKTDEGALELNVRY